MVGPENLDRATPVIKSVEFFNIELASLTDGRVYVSMTATTVDDQEPQLLTQEIVCNTVANLDDALSLIRTGLTSRASSCKPIQVA